MLKFNLKYFTLLFVIFSFCLANEGNTKSCGKGKVICKKGRQEFIIDNLDCEYHGQFCVPKGAYYREERDKMCEQRFPECQNKQCISDNYCSSY